MTYRRRRKTLKMAENSSTKRRVRQLKILKKIIYASALVLLTALLLLQVSQCVSLYLEEPTYFASRIVEQKDAQFPALTFCVEEERYKTDVLEAHGIVSTSNYNNKVNMTWSSNDSSVSELELFKMATYEVSEIFKEVFVRYFKADDQGQFSSKLKLDGSDGSFIEQRHRSFGRCYTLHPEKRHLGIYYMRFKLHVPVKIYFHANHQFLDLSGRMGYKVYLGQEIQAQVNYESINLLSRKQKDGNLTCIEDHYDECMYSALEKHMMDQYNCVVPYIRSEKDICTDADAVNGTFWIVWNRVTNQFNDCQLPCQAVTVTLSGKNTKSVSSTEGRAYFYFPPRILVNKENYFYSFLSTLAEIGGYVGLLLGISFLHLASTASEFIEAKIKTMEEEEKNADDDVEVKRFRRKIDSFNVGRRE